MKKKVSGFSLFKTAMYKKKEASRSAVCVCGRSSRRPFPYLYLLCECLAEKRPEEGWTHCYGTTNSLLFISTDAQQPNRKSPEKMTLLILFFFS